MSDAEQSSSMTRRTVVRGAAWSTPVVALGAAAPAMAASPPPVAPSVGPGSCRLTKGGVKRYRVELTFTNPLTCTTTVNISTFLVKAVSGQSVTFTDNPILSSFDISAGGSRSWTYDSDEATNISQGSVVIHYSYSDCGQQVRDEKQSIVIPSLNPCQGSDSEVETPEKDSGQVQTTPTTGEASQPSGTSASEETQSPEPSPSGTGGAANSSQGEERSTDVPAGTPTTGG